MGLVTQPLISR